MCKNVRDRGHFIIPDPKKDAIIMLGIFMLDTKKRISLAHLPTLVQFCPRLSDFMGGPELWMKRDDLTGLAGGGNKARKLEYLMADAVDRKADVVITAGGPQSNHCRQTAAAAVRTGLDCELVLAGSQPRQMNGNLLLDELMGASLIWTRKEKRSQTLHARFKELQQHGRRPYLIPVGGSNAVGALGYVRAMLELVDQMRQQNLLFDTLVFASSSGGTQAGMAVGARLAGFEGRILGISIDRVDHGDAPFRQELAELANTLVESLAISALFTEQSFDVNYDYLGQGYGVMGGIERDAIRLVAKHEGIMLDPVYTGRAMAGLIDLIRNKTISKSERVLFWHTGGTPALFAYADELLDPVSSRHE